MFVFLPATSVQPIRDFDFVTHIHVVHGVTGITREFDRDKIGEAAFVLL